TKSRWRISPSSSRLLMSAPELSARPPSSRRCLANTDWSNYSQQWPPTAGGRKRKGVTLMLERGPAKKLVVYVNALQHYQTKPVYEALVQFFHRHDCAGATVTRALSGYGESGKVH